MIDSGSPRCAACRASSGFMSRTASVNAWMDCVSEPPTYTTTSCRPFGISYRGTYAVVSARTQGGSGGPWATSDVAPARETTRASAGARIVRCLSVSGKSGPADAVSRA